MKRPILVALLTLVISSLLFAQGKKSDASKTEQDVLKMAEAFTAAVLKSDVATLDRLLVDEAVLTSSDGSMSSKAALLEQLKSGALKYDVLRAEDRQVRIFGNVAITSARFARQGQAAGRAFNNPVRSTAVYLRQGERWQIISVQNTLVTPTN